MAQSSGEAFVELVATVVEVLAALFFVEGEEFFLYLLELGYQLFGAVAHGVVCSDEVKVVVVDDGVLDIGVGLQHVEEQSAATNERFYISDVGDFGKVDRKGLRQYVYVLTLRSRPFDKWLSSYIQSCHPC